MKVGPVGLNKTTFDMTLCHDRVGAALYFYIHNIKIVTRAY